MQKVLVKLDRIEAKPDVNKSNLKLLIHYNENNVQKTAEKTLLAEDSIDSFVSSFMKELRNSIKNAYAKNSEKPFDSFVTVVFDESDVGEAEEDMVSALKRLRDKVRGFRSVKSADNYMNKFYDMSKLEVKL